MICERAVEGGNAVLHTIHGRPSGLHVRADAVREIDQL